MSTLHPASGFDARLHPRDRSGRFAEAQHLEGPTPNVGQFEVVDLMATLKASVEASKQRRLAAQQSSLDAAPVAADPDGIVVVEEFVQEDTFSECGEYTPISDGDEERGIVGVSSAVTADGARVEVVSQVAVSEDEDGRWWNIHQTRQTVTTTDGRTLFREIAAGNIDSRTWASEDEAWAALQDARGSLTADSHRSSGYYDIVDDDWYQEV